MASGQKLASASVQNRRLTPLFTWIRDRLLAVRRSPATPLPGLPTEDGEAIYRGHTRFPNTQSARTQPAPNVPGGVHHLLADNHYYARDARRDVHPPIALYASDQMGAKFQSITGETIDKEKVVSETVSHGPDANFGLRTPTPGFGYEWKREVAEEETWMQTDRKLSVLERYDRYSKQK